MAAMDVCCNDNGTVVCCNGYDTKHVALQCHGHLYLGGDAIRYIMLLLVTKKLLTKKLWRWKTTTNFNKHF